MKVLDFGLAQTEAPLQTTPDSESPTALKTRDGVLLGTLHYMSPEQLEGKTLDARSDTFSLGIVFYEMLCGRRPFEGDTLPSTLSSLLKDDPAPLRPEFPRELWRIVRKCLVKDPERRYQSSKDVRLDLEELKHERDSGELEPEAGVAPTASRWRAGLVGAFLALASGLVWGICCARAPTWIRSSTLSASRIRSRSRPRSGPKIIRAVARRTHVGLRVESNAQLGYLGGAGRHRGRCQSYGRSHRRRSLPELVTRWESDRVLVRSGRRQLLHDVRARGCSPQSRNEHSCRRSDLGPTTDVVRGRSETGGPY